MTCEALDQRLDAYVDRELDDEAARAICEHLAACSACRKRVDEREALRRLVRSAPRYVPSKRLRARVTEQIAQLRLTTDPLPWPLNSISLPGRRRRSAARSSRH